MKTLKQLITESVNEYLREIETKIKTLSGTKEGPKVEPIS